MVRSIFFSFLLMSISLTSCEEVVDVELNYDQDQLVIEGRLNWIKESQTTEQVVILSKTTPYFDSVRIPVNKAVVQVIDNENRIYEFKEESNTGTYYPTDSIPFLLGKEYTLVVESENQRYRGKEVLNPVAPIYKIVQDSIPLFGLNAIQLEAYSIDDPNQENYTYFEFISDRLDEPAYNVYRDDFSNGTEYYGVLLDDDLEKGDRVQFRQYSLSKTAYQYWYLLITQNTQQGGPFQTNPANLRGNIINLTAPENSPLGYFRVSEVSEVNYVVE